MATATYRGPVQIKNGFLVRSSERTSTPASPVTHDHIWITYDAIPARSARDDGVLEQVAPEHAAARADANAQGEGENYPGGCQIGVGDTFSVSRAGDGILELRHTPGTSDQEVERAGEREQLVGQRPSGVGAGQHTEASDRRRAGDAFMQQLQNDRRTSEDHIEGLRSWSAVLAEHYRNSVMARRPSPSPIELGLAARFLSPGNRHPGPVEAPSRPTPPNPSETESALRRLTLALQRRNLGGVLRDA
jgi:hypothetical protein